MAKGPTWFKMHESYLHTFSCMSDDSVGKALKYALVYIGSGEEPDDLDPMARIAFNMMKQSIKEAWFDYFAKSDAGQKGAAARKEKENERFFQGIIGTTDDNSRSRSNPDLFS